MTTGQDPRAATTPSFPCWLTAMQKQIIGWMKLGTTGEDEPVFIDRRLFDIDSNPRSATSVIWPSVSTLNATNARFQVHQAVQLCAANRKIADTAFMRLDIASTVYASAAMTFPYFDHDGCFDVCAATASASQGFHEPQNEYCIQVAKLRVFVQKLISMLPVVFADALSIRSQFDENERHADQVERWTRKALAKVSDTAGNDQQNFDLEPYLEHLGVRLQNFKDEEELLTKLAVMCMKGVCGKV